MNKLDLINMVYVVLVFIALALGANALIGINSNGVWYMVFMFVVTLGKWVWDRGKYN